MPFKAISVAFPVALDAVRDEGGYNLGEQVFVFYKEERDENHRKQPDVDNDGAYLADETGDVEV